MDNNTGIARGRGLLHSPYYYEPITVKGLLTYSAELLDIYLQGPLQAMAKKTVGHSIGTLYSLGQENYLGKINCDTGFFDDDPNSIRTSTRKDLNTAAIFEKIAYDVYKELGKGLFDVPASFLSLQVLQDDYHLHDKTTLALSRAGVESCLRILSKYPACEGYQDFSNALTLDYGLSMSFVDYVHLCHRPPKTLLAPDGTSVPISGLIELLAVMRAIADTDGLGGTGGNAGFVWIKDDQANIVAAQTVKIDPGAAFTCKERDKEETTNFVFNQLREGDSKHWLADLRDIQTANNDRKMTIHWKELSEMEQDLFLATLINCLRYKNNAGVSDLLINRDGKFRMGNSKIEKLPKRIGQEIRTAFSDWLSLQEKIYAENLQAFESKYPDEVLRLHYIDQWGECSLPMSEETFPVRELFTELALASKPQQEIEENQLKSPPFLIENEHIGRGSLGSASSTHQKATKRVSLPDMFDAKGMKPVRHVLLTGAAGVGKSTLCQKIAHDWASGRLFKERFRAVYWIPLRILNTAVAPGGTLHGIQDPNLFLARTLAELVLNRPYLAQPFLEQLQENRQKVLFLLDGYDEASEELRIILSPLIENPELHLLLTSRPGATEHLQDSIDRSVENLGFAKEHINIYSERFFNRNGQTLRSRQRQQAFMQALQHNSHLSQIAHTPLQLQMLCVLWEKGAEQSGFGSGINELYQTMIDNLLCWQHRRQKSNALPIFENEHQQLFDLMGDIALKGFSSGKLMISQDIVLSLLEGRGIKIQELLDTGLLKVHGTGSNTHYYFLHLTFQEYFIADSLSRAAEEVQQNFILENLSNPTYNLVMVFLAGIVYRTDQSANKEALQAFFNTFYEGLRRAPAADQISQIEQLFRCLNQCANYKGSLPVLGRLWNEHAKKKWSLWETSPDDLGLMLSNDLYLDKWLIKEGLVHALRITINELGFAWLSLHETAQFAASVSHLELLQLMYEKDPKAIYGKLYYCDAMSAAAENGHLEVMQWLHERDPELILSKSSIAMQAAAEKGQLDAMKWLHEQNPSLIQKVVRGLTAMHAAAKGNQLDAMKWLYEQDPTLIQKVGDDGLTAMHCATEKGQLDAMKWLHEQDPTLIQSVSKDGSTPMHTAAQNKNLQAMQWLHEQDPTLIQRPNNKSKTVAKMINSDTFKNGWLKAMQWLHKVDPLLIQQVGGYFGGPMLEAAEYSDLEAMRWLHSLDPLQIQKVDRNGFSVMHYAMSSCRASGTTACLELMNWLYEQDSSLIRKVSNSGQTVMHVGAQYGTPEVLSWLHERNPELIFKTMENGATPMHVGAQYGTPEVLSWLHERNPELILKTMESDETPMHVLPPGLPSLDKMKWLYKQEPLLIQKATKDGVTVMHYCARGGSPGLVKWLHEQDPSLIQKLTNDGLTVMHYAVDGWESESYFVADHNDTNPSKLIQWLYEQDPSLIQKTDNQGLTAMHWAAKKGYLWVMKELHKLDSSLIQKRTNDGSTIMHCAVDGWKNRPRSLRSILVPDFSGRNFSDPYDTNYPKLIQWLHEQDPSLIQKTDNQGWTTMHWAAGRGYLWVMKKLHELDPLLIQKVNNYGWNAMHVAVRYGHLEVMTWLHEKNSSLIKSNLRDGTTLIDLATKYNQQEVIEWLKKQSWAPLKDLPLPPQKRQARPLPVAPERPSLVQPKQASPLPKRLLSQPKQASKKDKECLIQ